MVQRTALSSAEPDIRSAVTIRVAAQITLFGRGTGGHAADHTPFTPPSLFTSRPSTPRSPSATPRTPPSSPRLTAPHRSLVRRQSSRSTQRSPLSQSLAGTLLPFGPRRVQRRSTPCNRWSSRLPSPFRLLVRRVHQFTISPRLSPRRSLSALAPHVRPRSDLQPSQNFALAVPCSPPTAQMSRPSRRPGITLPSLAIFTFAHPLPHATPPHPPYPSFAILFTPLIPVASPLTSRNHSSPSPALRISSLSVPHRISTPL